MKKFFNALGMMLLLLFAACHDDVTEYIESEQESSSTTRAVEGDKEGEYYWSGGQKIWLDTDYTQMIVNFETENQSKTFAETTSHTNHLEGRTMTLVNVQDEKIKQKISADKFVKNQIFAHKFSGSDIPFYLTGDIAMKPQKGISPEDILAQFEVEGEIVEVSDTGVVVVRLNDWNSILTTANSIYESDLVKWCHPDFITIIERTTSDPLFSQQWNLKNTGQRGSAWSGIDIKAETAWATSKGSNIRVAVIDDGVENHGDLAGRVLQGYTPLNPTGYGKPTAQSGLPNGLIGHGQACAGIIAASHNSLGVAGVAPNVQIVPINIFHTWQQWIDPYYGIIEWRNIESVSHVKSAIEYAWNPSKGNADVISNSWEFLNGAPSNADWITDEITNAVTQGRGGKGCVVVFSSGNDSGGNGKTVSFPALLSNVIAVGAISFNGQRKSLSTPDGENWGSNYGDELDVVAPGVYVQTTDREGSAGYSSGSTYDRFNGTSAACPHVSGIAALILSKYPNFTRQQVVDIIESTARKVGGYTYSATPGRTNGKWNNQMGYGLVNANAALFGDLTIDGPDRPEINTYRFYSCEAVAGMPAGATFQQWTVTGGAYEINEGLNEPYLVIMFKDNATYTLTATYRFPDGSFCSAQKSVGITMPTPPMPVIECGNQKITHSGANGYDCYWSSLNGQYVTFSVRDWDDYTNYHWSSDKYESQTAPYYNIYAGSFYGNTLLRIQCRAERYGVYSQPWIVYLYVSNSPYQTWSMSATVDSLAAPSALVAPREMQKTNVMVE